MQHVETIIVGGGPAGSSCAWRLHRQAHDVAILERQRFPRVKLCAGWITGKVMRDLQFTPADYPHSILQLDIRTHFGSLPFALRWFPTPDQNYSIRRVEFDDWLLQRAEVPVIQHTVSHIRREADGYVIDDRFICRNLVGAGGTMCPVRRLLFPENRRRASQIVTLEKEFLYPDREEICHLYFFQRGLKGYSWYVPKADGAVNIGLGGKCRFFRRSGATIHDHFRAFLDQLIRERRVDEETVNRQRFTGHPYFLTSYHGDVQKDRCFLIGDSAGLATIDLGEGIGPAIESGLAVADTITEKTGYSRKPITKYSTGGMTQRLLRRILPVRGAERASGRQPPDSSRRRAA
jgi:flavin-dependent dehydrogenase